MKHLFTWCLLLTVLCVSPPGAADGPDLCVVGRLATPAFSAVRYQRVQSSGCFSRRVTPRGEEVHTIRLATHRRGPRQRQGRPKVTLNVLSPTDGRSYSKEIILVLDSSSSVDWNIYGRNGFQNDTKFQIIVTKRSRVVHCDLSPVTVKSQRVRSREALLKFVLSRLQAVTSFTDVRAPADALDLTVGIDLSAPDTCDTQANLRASAGLVPRAARPVQLDGCYHRHLAGLGLRDVYVVEVAEERAGIPNNRVEIRLLPPRNRKSVSGNLTMILKSAGPITWLLTADGFSGDVRIMTEYPVLSRDLPPSVTLETKQTRLPASFNDLLIFAVGYSSGPPVAYVRAVTLSRLDVRVSGAPDDVTNEVLPADDARDPPGRDHASRDVSDGAESPSGTLRRSVSVSCSAGLLTVAVPAPAAADVSVSALHLAARHCASLRNGTHLVVNGPLSGCGTRRRKVRGRTVYVNTVHFVSSAGPQDDEDFEGSGGGPDGAEDGQGWQGEAGRTTSGGSVPISCAAPDGHLLQDDTQDVSLDIDEVGPSVYRLDIALDSSFTQPIKPNSLVPVSHDIYIRSALHMASYLVPVVEECWVGAASGGSTAPITLVSDACPAMAAVSAVPRRTGTVYRVQVTRQIAELGPYYLHCRVGVCAGATSAARQHIVQCRDDREDHCSADTAAVPGRRLASGVQVITKGPLLSAIDADAGEVAAGRRPVLQLGVSYETVAGIGVSAFLLGVLLMAGVWLIHSKIGPSKRHQFQAVPQNPSLEAVGQSANSTPNSQTPIILAGRPGAVGV